MSFSDYSNYNTGDCASSAADLGFEPAELEAIFSSIYGDVGTENTDTISTMSSPGEDTPSSSNSNSNSSEAPCGAFLEVGLGGEVVLRVPASTLTQQGPLAVVQQLAAVCPPPSPWPVSAPSDLAQSVWDNALLPAGPSSPPVAACPPAAEPHQWFDFGSSSLPASSVPVPGQFDLPGYGQFDFPAAPDPAAVYAAPVAASPAPRPRPRAANANAATNPRRKTPPGFPGYRWVAQQVALRSGVVQLGDVYAHMAAAWPDYFGAARPSGAWKSGVRHAVGKHFRRVPAGRAPAGGVWYEVDPENVMGEEEMWRVVGGK